jgi:rubrerythrin
MKKNSARGKAAGNRRGTTNSNHSTQARNGSAHARARSSRSNNRTRASKNPISQEWFNDFLSEMLAVEEGGQKLYQKALDELQHDELRDKLEEFHEETQRHIELVQELMEAAGVDESHKSPGAEAAEQKAQGLLSVEVEEKLRDLNNIENLVLAETKDNWDWEMLNSLVGRIQKRELKDAVRSAVTEVFKQEREHLQWNQDTLTELAMEMATREESGEEASDAESEGASED